MIDVNEGTANDDQQAANAEMAMDANTDEEYKTALVAAASQGVEDPMQAAA